MKFSKYEGLGNDFIVVERPDIDAQLAKRLCDRRLGIGGDGVLVVEQGQVAPFRMTVYNADGSIPEMCGNGLRCVVRHLQRTVESLPRHLTVETGAGPLPVSWDLSTVTAELGAVDLFGERTIELDGQIFTGQFLSTGNPHFVLFGAFDTDTIERYGPQLETHAAFPEGANISFATALSPKHVNLIVWERGCGLTQACGTGACATTVAGWANSHLSRGDEMTVTLPGGHLYISGSRDNVIMRGPARHVFDGVWPSN